MEKHSEIECDVRQEKEEGNGRGEVGGTVGSRPSGPVAGDQLWRPKC